MMTRMGSSFLSDFVGRELLTYLFCKVKPLSTTHATRNKRGLRVWIEILWLFLEYFLIIILIFNNLIHYSLIMNELS